MTITQTPAITIGEKAARARKLIEEVRGLNLDATTEGESGVNTGEKASEARAKMEEAVRLSAEVKTLRSTSDADVAKNLLAEFDLKNVTDTELQTGGSKGLISGLSSSEQTSKAFGLEGAFSKETQLQLTAKAGDYMESIKALSTGTAGGLVPPTYIQDMFADVRRQGNALRRYGWLNIHPVTDTAQILIPKGTGSASVGWVAENATKPSTDQGFTQVTVNIFTAAGISKISKQLAMNSNPTAVDLAVRELGSLLAVLEEQAAISGTGTGQPRGILNTTGVNPVTVGTNTAAGVLDALLDAIVAIQTTYFGAPNGALMHPRRLAFLQKGKDTSGQYLLTPAGGRGPGGGGGLLNSSTPFELLGIPVGVSTNIPTNLGAGTNQDAIIVGDWNEAHWFQNQEQTLDASEQAGTAFEQNQVWYRLEEQAGFSAERYPTAFAAITGAGLVP